ncbi:Nucleolar protein 4-like, partial [Camelus dromedarius]
DETSVSSEDFDMNDSTWMSADPHLASSLSPSQDERMRSPQNLHSQEDGIEAICEVPRKMGVGSGEEEEASPPQTQSTAFLGQRDPAPTSVWGKESLLAPRGDSSVHLLPRDVLEDSTGQVLPAAAVATVPGGPRGQWILGWGLIPRPFIPDDSSSESGSGNGSSTLNPSTSSSTQGDPAFPEMNGNGAVAPMDFTATAEDQPINLCDKLPQGSALGTPSYPSDGCGADGLRSRVKYGVKTTPESPPYSSGSYDSIKTEVSGCPEDLTVGRAPTADDDDDDHDDHEDNDKMNDSEGMDPERLKAFNMFVRLFVDENLDRMVPISKQPKEKIQAIIESCSRQFPEFQERARKRIRTYLKSCRRMKKNGMEMTRPTPPHLTSAMAENILAAACESETRKAAKRMRLEIYQSSQDEPIALDKQHSRDSAAITHSTYSLPASSYSQDPVYVNGGLNYSYRSYGALGSNLQPPSSLQTGNHSNGPTDLSMKGGASTTSTTPTPTPSSNSTSRTMPTAQLSPTEISAVRQLIAGYRESAAFLLRSADELENLILQQN